LGTASYESLLTRYASKELGLIFPFVILSYTLGHIVSFVSSISVERYALWLYGHPAKNLLHLNSSGFWEVGGSRPLVSVILRLAMFTLLSPISFWELALGWGLSLRKNYVCKFDPLLREAVRVSINKIVRACGVSDPASHGDANQHDLSKLAMHYAIEHMPNHVFTLRNYVALYGYLRSLCFVLVVVCWSTVFHVINWNWNWVEIWWVSLPYGHWLDAATWIIPPSILAFGLFLAFCKFHTRYHEETLLAITAASAGSAK
jgi:hypothetical protein